MGLTRNTIYQINATVIAGLLILFTIQSVVSNSLYDLSYSYLLLDKESELLNELSEGNKAWKDAYEKAINNDEPIMLEPESTDTGELTFTIPPYPDYLAEQEKRLILLTDENIKNQLILQSKFDAREDLPIQLVFYTNPQLLVSILIIPFIGSMISESISYLRNKHEKNPSSFSICGIIIGLLLMAGFFVMNLITHIIN